MPKSTHFDPRHHISMDSSQVTFLRLPQEIRCQIYWCVGMPTVVFFDNRWSIPDSKTVIVGGSARRTLWNTCRQTREELQAADRMKYDFTIQIMGMANLGHVAGRMPACMDFGRIKEVYVTLTGAVDFSVEHQTQWLIDSGLGMTGDVLIHLMPNLQLFQVEAPQEAGQLRDRLKALVVVLGGPIVQQRKNAKINTTDQNKISIVMEGQG